MIKLLAAALLLLVVGCDRVPGTNAHMIRQAEAQASHDLADPASAQFRETVVAKAKRDISVLPGGPVIKQGASYVCGQMNAKNHLGAYTGFKGFIVEPATETVFAEPNDGVILDDKMKRMIFTTTYATECSAAAGLRMMNQTAP